jgi:hypothetical protein
MPNWSIIIEPRGEIYNALVRTAGTKGLIGGLVVQNFRSWDASFATFMSELARHTLSVEETTEWPGTVQFGGNKRNEGLLQERPRLHKFPLNQDIAHFLTNYACGLYDWRYPCLPEDLCFFDHSGRAWMTTISHERDAYLTLTRSELHDLLVLVPGLTGQWDPDGEDQARPDFDAHKKITHRRLSAGRRRVATAQNSRGLSVALNGAHRCPG